MDEVLKMIESNGLYEVIEKIEEQALRRALAAHPCNKAAAAHSLKLLRTTYIEKLRKYDLFVPCPIRAARIAHLAERVKARLAQSGGGGRQ